jgi:hypothetical protein
MQVKRWSLWQLQVCLQKGLARGRIGSVKNSESELLTEQEAIIIRGEAVVFETSRARMEGDTSRWGEKGG